jgi:DNA ligase-1
MNSFARLFFSLNESNKTKDKLLALRIFFEVSEDKDKVWAIALLSGRKIKRTVSSTQLRAWAAEAASLPSWLFDESYEVVGDIAETISLLCGSEESNGQYNLHSQIEFIRQLGNLPEDSKKEHILAYWNRLSKQELFVFCKLITGGFRMGVSTQLMVKSLSDLHGIDPAIISHRIMGDWSPDELSFEELIIHDRATDNESIPYPFCLAYPLDHDSESLGECHDWQVEYKWDGIRGQIIKRNGAIYIWSRGEELITDKFPELHAITEYLPDGTVVDGEIVAFKDGQILPFGELQTRIGRKNLSKKLLNDHPSAFIAYDVLEYEKEDLRGHTLKKRREVLESLHQTSDCPIFLLSRVLRVGHWEDVKTLRNQSRSHQAEGLMLKRLDSIYHTGRKRGDWWKWKTEPLSIDAVLVYAQKGHGRRADLYTDYTFSVWHEGSLVPFAKAYSGLTDKEIREVDRFIKKNTLEKFGPVRTVKAELVFEIGFEGISKSTRHKSGIAVRFPRILRWRLDKTADQADTLHDLQLLLNAQ